MENQFLNIFTSLHGPIIGEFVGTMVMLVLGDGVVANVLLGKAKGQNSGWIVITTGWAMAVLFGIIASLAVGGVAHLNPVISIVIAITSGDYSNLLPYIFAQISGAMAAGCLVWLIYLPHWKETDDKDLKLAVFCTDPAIRNLPLNAMSEFLVTIILVFVGFSIGSKGLASNGVAVGMSPYFWGMLVWGIGLSLGGATGYAINPARDLGPRIAHAILPIYGKGGSDWGYAPVPVIAPILGAVVGAILVKLFGIV